MKARTLLKSLYDSGLESPLAGTEDGPAKLLPFLVRALEDVTLGLGPTAEAEARVLSSAALPVLQLHEANPLRAAPPPTNDSVMAPVLLSASATCIMPRGGAQTCVWCSDNSYGL